MDHRRRDVARERVQRVAELSVAREDLRADVRVRVRRRRAGGHRDVAGEQHRAREVVDPQVLIAGVLRRKVLAEVEAPAIVADRLDPQIARQLDALWLAVERGTQDRETADAGLWRGGRPRAEALRADDGLDERQPGQFLQQQLDGGHTGLRGLGYAKRIWKPVEPAPSVSSDSTAAGLGFHAMGEDSATGLLCWYSRVEIPSGP